MTPELDHIRTGIIEDALADSQAVIRCIVLAVERQNRELWRMTYDVARDMAGRAGDELPFQQPL